MMIHLRPRSMSKATARRLQVKPPRRFDPEAAMLWGVVAIIGSLNVAMLVMLWQLYH